MAAHHWLAALAACTLACSTGSTARPKVTYAASEGVAHTPAPRSPEQVEIRALGAPARTHAIVGRFTVEGDDDDRVERGPLMQALRARAAELGCEAVLLEPPFEEQRRVRFRYEYLTMTRPVLHGACVVYE